MDQPRERGRRRGRPSSALVVSAGRWLAIVELVPKSDRPDVGVSATFNTMKGTNQPRSAGRQFTT